MAPPQAHVAVSVPVPTMVANGCWFPELDNVVVSGLLLWCEFVGVLEMYVRRFSFECKSFGSVSILRFLHVVFHLWFPFLLLL